MQQEAQLKLFPKHFHDAVDVVPLMWGLCWPEAPTQLTRSWGAKTLPEHLHYSAGLSVASQFLTAVSFGNAQSKDICFLSLGFLCSSSQKRRGQSSLIQPSNNYNVHINSVGFGAFKY